MNCYNYINIKIFLRKLRRISLRILKVLHIDVESFFCIRFIFVPSSPISSSRFLLNAKQPRKVRIQCCGAIQVNWARNLQ